MAIRDLTVGDVVAINEAEIGPHLLVEFGLLESAYSVRNSQHSEAMPTRIFTRKQLHSFTR